MTVIIITIVAIIVMCIIITAITTTNTIVTVNVSHAIIIDTITTTPEALLYFQVGSIPCLESSL